MPNTFGSTVTDLGNGTPKFVVPVGLIQPIPGGSHFNPFAYQRESDEQVKNATIMIVDDEPTVALALRKCLSEAGFKKFVLLNNAAQTIKQVQQSNPDLVLLDIRMQVNGLEVLETMRAQESMQHIPVIMLTGDTNAETRIRALACGAEDFMTKPVDLGEFVARVRNTLNGKVLRDRLVKHSSELATDALRDALTQLANRRAFEYELDRRMVEWRRQRKMVSLIMLDLDHFKKVNDLFGLQTGDLVLCAVAKEIQRLAREMDLVARYGGEEFAIILPGCNENEAGNVGERMRTQLEALSVHAGQNTIRLTVSVGVAAAQENDDSHSLVRRADQAMYAAKQSGRNCCHFHDGSSTISLLKGESKGDESDTKSQGRFRVTTECASIFVIDDEPSTVLMIRKILSQSGYVQVHTETDSTKAFDKILSSSPDLVLCDIHMPGATGLDILSQIRGNRATRNIPVVFLSSCNDVGMRINCLTLGATDFLSKPVNAGELIARVRNTILAKAHLDSLADYSGQLEREVRLRTAELDVAWREAIQCLARAGELKDDQTGKHVFRVGRYAAIIAKELGFGDEWVQWLEYAAQLHDLGKIGIPDSILNKPGRLTDDEMRAMREHCEFGRRVIKNETIIAGNLTGDAGAKKSAALVECHSPIMQLAAVVAESHHEKWDGTGYPHRLQREDIPLEGRITAVADVFDAMSSKRVYKDAMPIAECFDAIQAGSGSHFDPTIVKAFLNRRSEITAVFLNYNDSATVSDDQQIVSAP